MKARIFLNSFSKINVIIIFLFHFSNEVLAQNAYLNIESSSFNWNIVTPYTYCINLDFSCDGNGGVFLSKLSDDTIHFHHFDSTGVLIWDRSIWNYPSDTSYYSAALDTIIHRYSSLSWLNRMSVNAYAVAGYVDSIIQINSVQDFYSTLLFAKIDTSGSLLWSKSMGFHTNGRVSDFKTSLNSGNSWAVIGTCVAKLDSAGTILWVKNYYDTALIKPSRVVPLENDDAFIIGKYLNIGTVILKINPAGTVLWSKLYSTTTAGESALIILRSGDFILINSDYNRTPSVALIKCDSIGTIKYSKAMDDSIMAALSMYYITWFKLNEISDDSILLTTPHYYLLFDSTLTFFARVKVGYNYEQAWDNFSSSVGNTKVAHGKAIDSRSFGESDHQGFSYGNFYYRYLNASGEQCDFNEPYYFNMPFNYSDSLLAITDSAFSWVAKDYFLISSVSSFTNSITSCILGGDEKKSESIIEIYPNPTTGSFHLKMPEGVAAEKNIFIYDLTGREVYSTLKTFQTEFDFSLHAKGIYLVKVADKERTVVVKVVVM